VTFIPKTIRTLITSSAESDGKLTVTARRQLKQQADRRKAATIQYEDQRADDLTEVADESVDVVISLQAAERMRDNGLDWKKSVQEAARVLKPGGRLLFTEATNIDGVSYLDYVRNLYTMRVGEGDESVPEGEGDENDVRYPVFDEVGSDDVDLVIVPHIAGVAIKAMDAGMSPAERAAKAAQEEKDRLADLSIAAFERGNKKRRKKKKKADEEAVENA
jgi:SAM-dependent methyltransferase